MLVVERHIISNSHRFWKEADDLAFRSKNLYNLGNYHIRQHFFATEKLLSLSQLYKLVKGSDAYSALPAKVSNQVICQLRTNWASFFAALKEYRANPTKFQGRPKLLKYKHKTKGRNIVIYELGAISKVELRSGVCKLSQCAIAVPTQATNVKEARIVPRANCYVVEVVYERAEQPQDLNPEWIAGIDLGVSNLAAVASNKAGFRPFLVNGKPLKAINQLYNREKSRLQSLLKGNSKTSRRINQMTHQRNCRVESYLHHASRLIINNLVANRIGKLVIGLNADWKQEVNHGRVNNQNFVSIPHARFAQMLKYKAALVGIEVTFTEESYTSKCSFLDSEPLVYQQKYLGKRVHRGLFRSSTGVLLNADVNGAYNMVRKVFGNGVFTSDSIVGYAASPVKVHPLRSIKV